jgi:hypothetical protein
MTLATEGSSIELLLIEIERPRRYQRSAIGSLSLQVHSFDRSQTAHAAHNSRPTMLAQGTPGWLAGWLAGCLPAWQSCSGAPSLGPLVVLFLPPGLLLSGPLWPRLCPPWMPRAAPPQPASANRLSPWLWMIAGLLLISTPSAAAVRATAARTTALLAAAPAAAAFGGERGREGVAAWSHDDIHHNRMNSDLVLRFAIHSFVH